VFKLVVIRRGFFRKNLIVPLLDDPFRYTPMLPVLPPAFFLYFLSKANKKDLKFSVSLPLTEGSVTSV